MTDQRSPRSEDGILPDRLLSADLAILVRKRFWTCCRSHDPRHPNQVPVESCADCRTVIDAEAALQELVRRCQRHA